MNHIHKQRAILIALIISCVAIAAGLALYALQQNINLFYSPSQIAAGQAPPAHEFRLGGLVQMHSVHHDNNSLRVTFGVTDNKNSVLVQYNGVLPDLFREGQSVVADGRLDSHNVFIADQVLAKHDERYMPAAVKTFLKQAKS